MIRRWRAKSSSANEPRVGFRLREALRVTEPFEATRVQNVKAVAGELGVKVGAGASRASLHGTRGGPESLSSDRGIGPGMGVGAARWALARGFGAIQ